MPHDADATRARLLRAAIDEFAAHGLAGGRVDRISAAARVNKRAIYDYFGSKDALFDAASRRVAEDLIEAVPLRSGDLAAYAGDLFDYLLVHPQTPRLLAWRRLERPETVRIATAFAGQLEALRPSGPIAGVDLVILVIGLANAWDLTGPDLVLAGDGDPHDSARLAAHRAAVVEAAGRLQAAA